jgi:hypothetical protein
MMYQVYDHLAQCTITDTLTLEEAHAYSEAKGGKQKNYEVIESNEPEPEKGLFD